MSSQASWMSTKDSSRKGEFPGEISASQRRQISTSREVFTGFVVFSSYAVAITCVTPVREVLKNKVMHDECVV